MKKEFRYNDNKELEVSYKFFNERYKISEAVIRKEISTHKTSFNLWRGGEGYVVYNSIPEYYFINYGIHTQELLERELFYRAMPTESRKEVSNLTLKNVKEILKEHKVPKEKIFEFVIHHFFSFHKKKYKMSERMYIYLLCGGKDGKENSTFLQITELCKSSKKSNSSKLCLFHEIILFGYAAGVVKNGNGNLLTNKTIYEHYKEHIESFIKNGLKSALLAQKGKKYIFCKDLKKGDFVFEKGTLLSNPLCSKSIYDFLNPKKNVDFARLIEKHRYGTSNLMPKQKIAPVEEEGLMWAADGYTLNVYVDNKHIMPTVYLIVDIATRKPLGWSFGRVENDEMRLEAFKMAIKNCGYLPSEIETDGANNIELIKTMFDAQEMIHTHRTNKEGLFIEGFFSRFQMEYLLEMEGSTGVNLVGTTKKYKKHQKQTPTSKSYPQIAFSDVVKTISNIFEEMIQKAEQKPLSSHIIDVPSELIAFHCGRKHECISISSGWWSIRDLHYNMVKYQKNNKSSRVTICEFNDDLNYPGAENTIYVFNENGEFLGMEQGKTKQELPSRAKVKNKNDFFSDKGAAAIQQHRNEYEKRANAFDSAFEDTDCKEEFRTYKNEKELEHELNDAKVRNRKDDIPDLEEELEKYRASGKAGKKINPYEKGKKSTTKPKETDSKKSTPSASDRFRKKAG